MSTYRPLDCANLPQAAWIWCNRDPDAPAQMAQFRYTFATDGEAAWTGFADTFYTLYCNGVTVGMGPVTGIRSMPRLTTWELTPYLQPGENVLEVEVWFEGREIGPTDADTLQAGLIGWLQTPEGIIATGPEWQARPGGQYTPARKEKRNFAARMVVIADQREEPEAWQAATVVCEHPAPERGTLRISPIPPLSQTRREPAALIDAGIAREGTPVETAEQVAERMHAQELESLVRPTWQFSVLSTEGREFTGYGLPESERIMKLSWPDLTERYAMPLAIPAVDGDFYLAVDMGLQTSGSVWIDIESETELTVDLGYADHLHLGRVNPALQGHSFADRIIVNAGRYTVHLPTDRGFRYLQVNFSGAALLHGLWMDEHVYRHDDAIRFRSSDATLNGVWELARATLHQCSLTVHTDNARRERQGWGGPDLYANMHGFIHTFGDLRLTHKMLEDYCDYFDANGFIPDWCPSSWLLIKWISAHDLWFPNICRDYLRFSDDRELAPRLLQISEAVVEYYGQQRDGVLLARAHDKACRWVEWNMNSAQAVSTWENLLAVAGWRAVAEMRKYLDQPGVEEAEATAETIRTAINDRLWHPRHRALAQGTLEDGALVDFCAQLDNAFALLHGILSPERQEAAYHFCAGKSGTWPTSRSDWQGAGQGERVRFDARKPVVTGTPFGSSICAQAIHRFGSAREAVQYIRYNFGAMIDEGEGTLWEMWPVHQREEVAATCFSQGYGSHIASTLVGTILGLTFDAPGSARLRWRPVPCGLEWIEGQVETLHGPVIVRMDNEGLHYQVPAGVTLVVEEGEAWREISGPAIA